MLGSFQAIRIDRACVMRTSMVSGVSDKATISDRAISLSMARS
ncbi:hypothetical protein [Sphingopyxis sp. BSNA05]|nr:hypothetical protein [Sphingopyxis sp. BSNA05]